YINNIDKNNLATLFSANIKNIENKLFQKIINISFKQPVTSEQLSKSYNLLQEVKKTILKVDCQEALKQEVILFINARMNSINPDKKIRDGKTLKWLAKATRHNEDLLEVHSSSSRSSSSHSHVSNNVNTVFGGAGSMGMGGAGSSNNNNQRSLRK
ncbi:MAG TPA: hypothetical protein VJL60_03465, partial [Gammaproteobacteria bacterium]|nr:hypothetical protein [Gammaproteobacteria bacterium]